MNTGIDKLILTTRDYIVKDLDKLGKNRTIKQGKTEEESLPVILVNTGMDHKQIKANSLFYNVPDFYNVSINQTGLQVIVNPSKVLHEYELSDTKKTIEVISAVEKNMTDAGILLDFLSSSVSRIDLAKQVITERSTKAYTPAYNFMRGRKMKGVQYETGYRWGNKQHENTLYDKSIESNLPFPNLLRNEVKTKTTSTTQKMTGIHNLRNLFDAGDTYLTEFYNDYLNKKLFSGSFQTQMTIDFDSEVERLSTLKKQGKNALLKYFAITGINEIIKKLGDAELIFQIMKEAGYSRNEVNKQRNLLPELLSMSDTKEIDVKVLINELRLMFAA
jgi:hypothetical protein